MDEPGGDLSVEEVGDVVAAATPYLRSWSEVQREQPRVPGVQAAVRVTDAGGALTEEHAFRAASRTERLTSTAGGPGAVHRTLRRPVGDGRRGPAQRARTRLRLRLRQQERRAGA